jgi:outer membrane immunogenic protein
MKLRNGILGLTLTSALALTAFPANADGIYQPGGYKDGPVYLPDAAWAGLYVGINGGYGWSNDNQLADPNGGPFGGVSPSGGFGGIQFGYNWQGGLGLGYHLVYGLEADLQGGSLNDRATDLSGHNFKSDLDYFGTLRGRVGYTFDRALVYFTGGFAYGGLHKSTDDYSGNFRTGGTPTGYVLGGGWEYKITPVWSAKAEYQYINLGNNDLAGAGFGTLSSHTGLSKDDDYHTFRVGLNYHFWSDYVPMK